MMHADLPVVQAIESRCHATPWQLSSFAYEIDNKDAILNVAVYDNQIVGYVCVRTILDVTHLLNISVEPEFRQKGIGTLLLKDVLKELSCLKPNTTVTLEVRESNIAAIKMYMKCGFKVVGKRRRYYQKPDEDAVIMQVEISK
jgi:ribosomal-protein-alanine N-acetyltransferase